LIDRPYVEEKLRAAVGALGSDRPIRERLRLAYIYGLELLEPYAFESEDRAEFEAICAGLNATGEPIVGGGSLQTSLYLMSDEEAEGFADRIIALAARYGQA
jgi:hypothetical protein